MTEHNVLYVLPDGKPKSSSSYSARASFRFCRRQFYLTRVRGWRRKVDGIALDLGKITEAAVVHQIRFRTGGADYFEKLWREFRESKDFEKKQYTKVEQDWENCLRIGREWLTIFGLRQDIYPFQRAQFQVPLSKKIFPDTSYGAIRNVSYLDIYSEPPREHPTLVRLPDYQKLLRPLITDVKTASKELEEDLVSLDPQLMEYAWMYDVPDVGFLWFVKKSHGFKHASRVTLLAGQGPYLAGTEVLVLDKNGKDEVWISTRADVEAYAKACTKPDGSSLTGKALDMAAQTYLVGSSAVSVPVSSISKQVVQFATARLNLEAIQDMGKVVGQTTVEMVVAHEQDFYPMEPGIRYPSDKCSGCDMRSICSGDNEERDRYLTRVGEEWLDSTIEE